MTDKNSISSKMYSENTGNVFGAFRKRKHLVHL